jgi:parallel beta-helix repeat protein
MKNVGLLCIAMMFLCGSTYADSTVWYVHPDSALNTIQAGLDSCANNDIVLVGPGTYYENVIWPNTQGIHLTSELGAETTIVDGNDVNTVLSLSGSIIDTSTVISGFTIQHGHGYAYAGYDWRGAGIYCYSSASPMIIDNIIKDNVADSMGGGILSASGASPIIRDNIISNNTAVWGSGVAQWDVGSCPRIVNNVITNNNALYYGGGIYTNYYAYPVIDSCTVTSNHAYYGGAGIFAYFQCSLSVKNTTVTGNINSTPGIGAVYMWDMCFASIDNCLISNPDSNTQGIECSDHSSAVVEGCEITGHNLYGVRTSDYSTANLNLCNLHNIDAYGVLNLDPNIIVNAEYNWWGDATGPWHPDSNPSGLGSRVSNYVDFTPWLTQWGIEEAPIIKHATTEGNLVATIFRGPLRLPKDRKCRVFDITGRLVEPMNIAPGIYFLEVDSKIVQKVVKVR